MYFWAAASSENDQGSNELGVEYGFSAFNDPIQGGHHPRNRRVLHAPLYVADLSAGIALVPGSVEILGCSPELHNKVAPLRLGFAPFFAP
jgi:hypothetical protein